jgi:hypothetical protein
MRAVVPSCLLRLPRLLGDSSDSEDGHRPFGLEDRACSCNAQGRLWRYSLHDYAEDEGPECFISPLAFECKRSQAVTELPVFLIFGYHKMLVESRKGSRCCG